MRLYLLLQLVFLMKILIPNATSPKNIGDLAILTGFLRTIKNKKAVKIHSADPHLHTFPASHTLYTWAVFENKKPHIRILRLIQLIVYTSHIKNYVKAFKSPTLKKLLDDYVAADVIIFAGGGYLRSQPGTKQALNLLMLLFMFYVAKNFNAKKIIAPISFGPFAYKWQESISAQLIRMFDVVTVREKFSYELLKKYNPKNLHLSSDTSLLLENFKKEKKNRSEFVLGFTIRKWLPQMKQKKFENEFAQALITFAQTTKCSIQPIVQVDAPEYGEDDMKLSIKIINILKKSHVKVLPIEKVQNLKSAESIYSSIDMLLGMRMHSNILAALCNTPFVAISYEYKTEGISNDLGVGKYCIQVNKVRKDNLYEILIKAYGNSESIKKTMGKKITRLRQKELTRWKNIHTLTA